MVDEKKPPLAKSYTVGGDTTEFNPWELQVHEISPELRRQISQLERPQLDPKCFEDTLPPNAAAHAGATAKYGAPIATAGSDPEAEVKTSSDTPTLLVPAPSWMSFFRATIERCRRDWALVGLCVFMIAGVVYLALADLSASSKGRAGQGLGAQGTAKLRGSAVSEQVASADAALAQRPTAVPAETPLLVASAGSSEKATEPVSVAIPSSDKPATSIRMRTQSLARESKVGAGPNAKASPDQPKHEPVLAAPDAVTSEPAPESSPDVPTTSSSSAAQPRKRLLIKSR